MRAGSERIGLMLAALSLAINILLSMAHMGMFGERLDMAGFRANTPVAAAPGFNEASFVAALAVICTGHGLSDRAASKDGGKTALFPTCPLCFFFAAATLVLALGNLLLVLRRVTIGRLRPLAATRRLSAFIQRHAQPRAPPSLWIAA
ncbi:MAG TPA: DUF2946 family protein [Parvibaculum sp.]